MIGWTAKKKEESSIVGAENLKERSMARRHGRGKIGKDDA